jgi:hypothetical protein
LVAQAASDVSHGSREIETYVAPVAHSVLPHGRSVNALK